MDIEKTANGTLETWEPAELHRAHQAREVVVIDVRTPQEYMLEHIEGALLMPLSFFDAASLPSQAGKRIVFHCGSGVRSEKVARMAIAEGLDPIVHLGGGFAAWKAAGLPYRGTDMATGAPKRVVLKG